MPEFRATICSDEYQIVRRMRFEAEDEFEAALIAQEQFCARFVDEKNPQIDIMEIEK